MLSLVVNVELIIRAMVALYVVSTIFFLWCINWKNWQVFNPIENYKIWINLNWFGVIILTVLLNLLFLPLALIYWVCKLFTVGREKQENETNWKNEIYSIIKNGCTDSDIEDFIESHPGINGKIIWDYVYDYLAPAKCKGCKHIQMTGTMPCIQCLRRANLKDYYENR